MKIVDVTGTHAHRFGKLVAIMAPKPAVDIKRRFQTASLKQGIRSSLITLQLRVYIHVPRTGSIRHGMAHGAHIT